MTGQLSLWSVARAAPRCLCLCHTALDWHCRARHLLPSPAQSPDTAFVKMSRTRLLCFCPRTLLGAEGTALKPLAKLVSVHEDHVDPLCPAL